MSEQKKPEDQKTEKTAELNEADLDKAVGGRMGPPASAPVVTQPS